MMKKPITLFAAILMGGVMLAQEPKTTTTTTTTTEVTTMRIEPAKVPKPVMTTFVTRHPSATSATWELRNGQYYATFYQDEKETHSIYDDKGNWVETRTTLSRNYLPIPVRTAIEREYVGYTVDRTGRLESVRNGTCYEARVVRDNEVYDICVASDGKLISRNKVEPVPVSAPVPKQ